MSTNELNRQAVRVGSMINGNDTISINLADENGNGKSIWWDLDVRAARYLANNLNEFLSQEPDYPEEFSL